MNKTRWSRRDGFTLIELLIVIIIIAILAGMMMMTTGSASDSAEATKIISDLRAFKGACLMFYADNRQWPRGSGNSLSKSLEKYLDRSVDQTKYRLQVRASDKTKKGYIGTIDTTAFSAGVMKKLKASAADAGLYAGATVTGMKIFADGNDATLFMSMR